MAKELLENSPLAKETNQYVDINAEEVWDFFSLICVVVITIILSRKLAVSITNIY